MKLLLAACSALALLVGPALAQYSQPAPADAPAAGATAPAAGAATELPVYTVADVPPEAPFGDIQVDLSVTESEPVQANLAALSEADRNEVLARCKVIVDNEANYKAEEVAFCKGAAGE